jgi:hypothetical protein
MTYQYTRKRKCYHKKKTACLDKTKSASPLKSDNLKSGYLNYKLTYPTHILNGFKKIPKQWKQILNTSNNDDHIMDKCIEKVYTTLQNIQFDNVITHMCDLDKCHQYTHFKEEYNIPKYSQIIHHLLKRYKLNPKNILDSKKKILNDNSLYHKCVNDLQNDIYTNNSIVYPTSKSLRFHDLLISIYSCPEILFTIESHLKILLKIEFDYYLNGNKYHYDNLFIYLDRKDLNKYNTTIFLNKVIGRILFINYYLDTPKLPNKIIIYLTNLKKKLPNYQKHKVSVTKNNGNNTHKYVNVRNNYTSYNVNSAVTNSYDIIMYRKEEVLKSILHELVHFHKIDARNYPNHLIHKLTTRHNISPENKYHIGEATTEVLANLFNVGFIIQEKYNLPLSSYIKDYKTHLIYEMIHNTIQVSKIVHFLGYTGLQHFCKLNISGSPNDIESDSKPLPLLRHNTCVFSYYILKLYLLNQIGEFMQYFHTPHYSLVARNIPNHYQCLDNLFQKSRVDTYLHKLVNYFIKNGPKDTQLRMTAHKL